jgi:hypothetical protein
MWKRTDLIIVVLIVPIALMVMNSAVLFSPPGGGFAVYAAAPVAAPREAPADAEIPSPKHVLALMRKVNSWQLANPVMEPGDRNWEP